ncbi:putative toxin-antitoxin system toxin component, PIN family [Oscillatoria acuminata]|uniref:Putative toxin-antitoxin system toxin component, PIN family n=1 Tax=Oscillatoria acuminata PCC 6304 TaxID=56110 RepID=K9TEQ5_9CYAN|nr:putative toxin-antitoxin system toxin component, PIN family [Oscillatoria acuminata]AFY80888.1 putative toxin-antitoxin system toxin component, PIN family [Oscillatoria acuminata PCC 6304]
MKQYQIIVDTNVLLAGLKSSRGASYKFLTLLNDGRWCLNVSTTLVLEYEEILKRERVQLGLTLEEVDYIVNGICTIARHRQIFYLWRPIARDPDDDFLVDLAVECQADCIITYNKRDLQEAERFGIRILSPKEFLQEVGAIE